MSGPSCCSTLFDLAAAPFSCSRSSVPTLGISRSIMNLLRVMNISTQGPPLLERPHSSDRTYAGKGALRRNPGFFRPLLAEVARQVTGHACAAPVAGFQFHPAAMQLDEAIDESQTQSCAR